MFNFYSFVKANCTITTVHHALHFKEIIELVSQVTVTRVRIREE